MTDKVSFVVGTEKRLPDILSAVEVMPLLEGAIKAGATYAALLAPDGEVLWEAAGGGGGDGGGSSPVMLEGEPVGRLVVRGGACGEYLKGIEGLLLGALQSLIRAGLKRILTTEIHASVVNQSYEELLETNRQLSASEGRYRELAGTLEQKVAERTAELERAHIRLLQQQKMASIGQLAAGMAHEINNPLGFITSNLRTLQKYAARLILMLDYYSSLLESDPAYVWLVQLSARKWQELKLDSICADVDPLIGQSLDGAERVGKIVADLKGFSHVDDSMVGIVDLNSEIDRTLSVLDHRFPPGTDIIKNYCDLPGYCCNPALVCQLFLSIIENALEARPEGLRLIISTGVTATAIAISFADNGPGIPKGIRDRIFDPFFTTKEVGAGTGMGLAVVYDIVAGYDGTVEVTCPAGGGTIVAVTLPLQRKRDVPVL
jgi:signal transduction histidine kinase